jgi:hypothetical protein
MVMVVAHWLRAFTHLVPAIVGTALVVASGPAQGEPPLPYSEGDVHKGKLKMPLHRGNTLPFELTVPATPNDCQNPLILTMEWDEGDNELVVSLEGDGALEPHPSIFRTEGVDFFPNAFNPQIEDVVDGRYQLWLVSAAGPLLLFYYQLPTLDLIGSELDFEEPPPNTIAIAFPTLYLTATSLFQPDENGDVDVSFTWEYDDMIRHDRPDLSHFYATFPPPNLCLANPDRLDLSTLRPYISDPRPAEEARPWSDWLRGGMLFDVTVEPPEYFVEPPRVTFIGTHQGTTAVGGGVPNGWKLDIDAAFMGVAPPIRPWQGAGLCEQTFEPVHDPGIDFCALAGG